MYHMIVEQTKKYRKRMYYDAKSNTFMEREYDYLGYARNFIQPYGWIKESGTPPKPHWDVILMNDNEFELGDEVCIKVIGVFMRNDGDHKFVAVETSRDIEDFSQLSDDEIKGLHGLYPRIDKGEGWFCKERAEKVMNTCQKPL